MHACVRVCAHVRLQVRICPRPRLASLAATRTAPMCAQPAARVGRTRGSVLGLGPSLETCIARGVCAASGARVATVSLRCLRFARSEWCPLFVLDASGGLVNHDRRLPERLLLRLFVLVMRALYVCMYVRVYVRMYACTYVRMYVCTYVRM